MDYRMKLKNLLHAAPSENCGGIKIYRLGDIANAPPPEHGDTWGEWRLNTTDPPSLDYTGGVHRGSPYWIPLAKIFRAGDSYGARPGVMQRIEHLHGKIWGRESMGDFVDPVLTIARYGYMKGGKHVSLYPEGDRAQMNQAE